MNLNFVAEVYDVLNFHIDQTEKSSAASSLVDFLIDNNYDVDDIKTAFAGEKEILSALEAYGNIDADEYDEEEYYDDEEDEDY